MGMKVYDNLTHKELLKLWNKMELERLVNSPSVLFMDNPIMNQLQFQWFNDDGNEATSTAKETVGTDTVIDLSGGDVTVQLRIVVEETAGIANTNYSDQFESDLNTSASWENVTTVENGDGVLVDTVNLTDGNNTTQRVGAGSFLTPNAGQTTDGSPGGSICDFVGSDETEFVCAITFVAASFSDGDTVDFRLGGVDTRTGGSNARATVSKLTNLSGTGDITAAPVAISGSGTSIENLAGTATINVTKAAIAATGESFTDLSGTATINLVKAAIAATGDHSAGLAGTAAMNLAKAAIAATATESFLATATLALNSISMAATGVHAGPLTATAALNFAKATLAATGKEELIGSAGIALQTALIAASGAHAEDLSGSAIISVAKAVLAANGLHQQNVTGTSAFLIAAMQLEANGILPQPVQYSIIRHLLSNLVSDMTRDMTQEPRV